MPSEVLRTGDTADIQCANLAVQYETYMHKKAQDKSEGITTSTEHSQEELLNMLKRVKN